MLQVADDLRFCAVVDHDAANVAWPFRAEF